MDRRLPHPLEAEIADSRGRVGWVTLVAYLGEDRWQADYGEDRSAVVTAAEILSLSSQPVSPS